MAIYHHIQVELLLNANYNLRDMWHTRGFLLNAHGHTWATIMYQVSTVAIMAMEWQTYILEEYSDGLLMYVRTIGLHTYVVSKDIVILLSSLELATPSNQIYI